MSRYFVVPFSFVSSSVSQLSTNCFDFHVQWLFPANSGGCEDVQYVLRPADGAGMSKCRRAAIAGKARQRSKSFDQVDD